MIHDKKGLIIVESRAAFPSTQLLFSRVRESLGVSGRVDAKDRSAQFAKAEGVAKADPRMGIPAVR